MVDGIGVLQDLQDPSSRLAFALDLCGPVMVVGAHCSSSPVAIDAACGVLTPGECYMEPVNPESDRDEKSWLPVPTEPSLWPVPDNGRLAAVCSYGVSGGQDHVPRRGAGDQALRVPVRDP
ncbi:beta-ketoacyl synthase N-terminal-like domain-containing protein [Streptomyces hokutonensis]|uniref:Beta-ketoacyl synthase N-terminal-like domain-containing protein n=1 Tax=Streptomyces hokutonensis TaxID=1306990 RepID=A0ABW6MN14_9ACTN